jgi:hypothetical protein
VRPSEGKQEPRLATRPDFDNEDAGQDCIDLAESAGVHLDPWQQFAVRVILARRADGKWAALRAAVLVARQNGKGEILLALELYWLVLGDPKVDRLVVHTAHEFKTSSEAFLRLKAVMDSHDWLTRRIKKPTNSHGEEGFLMTNGQRLRFLARSLNSGRGFTGDKVILDEAQQLPSFAMDALMPTLSARPNPQLVYAGTVPSERNDSEHWTTMAKRGRAAAVSGKVGRLAWMEWNYSERVPKEAMYSGDDPVLIAAREALWDDMAVAANPSLGRRHDWGWLDEERESLSYYGYIRERLNIMSSDPVGMVIPLAVWESLVWEDSKMVGRRAIAVDSPPGMDSAVICAMGRNQHGQWHGEVVEQHEGTSWVPVRVAEVVRKNSDVAAVVVDPGSPAGALIADIEAEGVEVVRVSVQQHAMACGMLYTRATQPEASDDGIVVMDPVQQDIPKRQFVHMGDPIITEALKVATKRPGPDGAWLWNRKDSGDNISPVVALTLAGYGLSTLPVEVDDPWGFWS